MSIEAGVEAGALYAYPGVETDGMYIELGIVPGALYAYPGEETAEPGVATEAT